MEFLFLNRPLLHHPILTLLSSVIIILPAITSGGIPRTCGVAGTVCMSAYLSISAWLAGKSINAFNPSPKRVKRVADQALIWGRQRRAERERARKDKGQRHIRTSRQAERYVDGYIWVVEKERNRHGQTERKTRDRIKKHGRRINGQKEEFIWQTRRQTRRRTERPNG